MNRRHFVYLSGLTFFTLPSNYSVILHEKIFEMMYYSNGGFNWNDLYYMPTHLREFYWRQLLGIKNKEKEDYDKAVNKNKSTKTQRR